MAEQQRTERDAQCATMAADILAAAAPIVDGHPSDLVIEVMCSVVLAAVQLECHSEESRVAVLRRFATAMNGLAESRQSTMPQPDAALPSNGEIKGAILNYMEVVAALFRARRDGPCLAERQPSRDTECLSVFQQLNDTGRTLKEIVTALPKAIDNG